MIFRMTTLAALIAAGTTGHAADTQTMKTVVVTATRSETDIDAVAATVTTIDARQIERRQPRDEADLFRDEPDIAFARDTRRFGATRINIRGIEDNRVAQLVDGVRLSDFYNGGGPTNFTMATALPVMSDFIKRVEIVRGPASSLYGSDAIGGVVGFLTLDPADVLDDGERFGGRVRSSWNSADESFGNTVLLAGRGEAVEVLFGYGERRASETDNKGRRDTVASDRSEPNPQTVVDRGVLGKLIFRPAAGHTLVATIEGREQQAETDILRLPASLPKVTRMEGDDRGSRVRGSLEWQHQGATALYDRLSVRLHHQEADTKNLNEQDRTNTGSTCSAVSGTRNNCLIEQKFRLEQRSTGLALQLDKGFETGALSHLLTYGVDLSHLRIEQRRDGVIHNLTTGRTTNSLAGETFPVRDFPVGETDTAGVFVQDEVRGLAGGRLTLIPGLRYDWRRLEPKVDGLAQQVLTANGKEAVEQTDGAFSPKLAALWHFTPQLAAFGQVARGFRAPNYEEVNGSFRNTAQRYGVSPNPDLEPETSTGVELGLRLATGPVRAQASVFHNRYRDFIESVRLNCPTDPNCIPGLVSTNMAVNLKRVTIRGAELRGAWEFMPGWRVDGALAWAEGKDMDTHQPLNSVDPARLTLGLLRDAGTWGAEARLRAATGKRDVNDWSGQNDPTPSPWFRPAGYGVVDISAWWNIHRSARVTASVNNLFDKKYWLWSDIRQADARDPAGVDFYTQPGRNFTVALQLDF